MVSIRAGLDTDPASHVRQLAIESVAVSDGQVAGARIAAATYVNRNGGDAGLLLHLLTLLGLT